ncbi:hypothetical protein [Pseudomonas umsongensis]|uniref:Uncharacterized protein n=1 Tax=Pseudomonas umsongensis TaxID=198618 RepID=A0AAE6ZVK2_9PSED|nr:hypothetical protein [Pseudomonas umsongensis]QJC78924.1 hypothetical protein HGP31_11585 [Pseudomonas umsongensis]
MQQRKRQAWLTLPASGIEEIDHGQESIETTSEHRCNETGRRKDNTAHRQALLLWLNQHKKQDEDI